MGKNRNWQNRVENAEARRAAAKQRKQRRDNRGANKHMVMNLFGMLDRYDYALRELADETWAIHVWTDSIPADSPPLLDMYEEQHEGSKGSGKHHRRPRSLSMGSESPLSSRKPRNRSNSFNETPSTGKKKPHPRSKEKETDLLTDDVPHVPRLCRDHFFLGRCDDDKSGGKKGGCRNVHYPSRYKTLATVVGQGKHKESVLDAKQSLASSAEAAAAHQGDADVIDSGSMEMVYYFSIDFSRRIQSSSQGAASGTVGDIISEALAERACGIASVAYLSINGVLLFDRYREGTILSDGEMQTAVLGIERRMSRSASVVSEEEAKTELDHSAEVEGDIVLPGPVLEHILTFLPDVSVASMSMVCQAWYNEIGRSSPALWRHLLQRRDWPFPDVSANARDILRSSFLSHYSAVRDVESVKLALSAMTSPTKRNVEEKEMVYQTFSIRRLAPQSPNGCIAVRVWSPNRVLAAYSHDCTLRLFQAVGKNADGGTSRACRELVCVSIDPYKYTRRRRCRLVAMGIDEDIIGCLCHVLADRDEHEAYVLTIMSRDDFLCSSDGSGSHDPSGSSIEKGSLHVIDIGEAVINFLLSSDEVDHRLLQLFDFLEDGGDLSDVEVLVSQSIIACGYGRFLVEVAISVPSLQFDDEEVDATMILLDRKLVLFSAAAEAIVWLGDSHPAQGDMLPRHEDLTMACLRKPRSIANYATCLIAVVSSSSPRILSGEIQPAGHFESPLPIQASEAVRHELLQGDDWQLRQLHQRPVVITETEIVAADVLVPNNDENDERKERRTTLSFYSRDGAAYSTLTLHGSAEAVRMEHIREEHVVVVCRVFEEFEEDAGLQEAHQAIENEQQPTHQARIYAVLVHVPSRQEIQRVCLLDDAAAFDPSSTYDVPIFFASAGETVGVGAWWKGIILTGSDVRAVEGITTSRMFDDVMRSGKKSKKKKRHTAKGNKKDGFARGMSLRG